MTTLRRDPTTDEWVIMAPERASRPHENVLRARPSPPRKDERCPFCPGNEDMTPPEVARVGGPSGWEQRVVPNRYPALTPGGSTVPRGEPIAREMDGPGRHEVVVESPFHDERMDEMSVDRLESVVLLWRARYRAMKNDPSTSEIVVFKNFGEGAGTSLIHPHSQIMAIPVHSPRHLDRYRVAARYFERTGRSVYLDVRDSELGSEVRVVAERDGFVAVAPFASGLPFETWILPRRRGTSFHELAGEDATNLARLLRDLLGALRRAAGDPDFNLVVESAPIEWESEPVFQWHVRILPRMTTAAGFELGAGMAINPVLPEEAAAGLRAALVGVTT